ncbi:hypothetical protein Ae201684P_012397 [Aphanomyces euteiches]|nr:hypothetical protein Ae201684P_012397 [Aphanomyces euteiches]
MAFRLRRSAAALLDLTDSTNGSGSDNEQDDDCDVNNHPLEMSCDIGDTTFRKGSIAITSHGMEQIMPNEASPAIQDCVVDVDELEILGLLGRGCSGTVAKAKDRRTNKFYAIKTVHNVYDKTQRDQILTEIHTLYSVRTPWLVDFHGAYFKDHALSLILQFCDRGSLDTIVRSVGSIPERILACMTFQILNGLQQLREARHFHRDIKPQNILVTSDGYVKLTDFGLARQLQGTFDMAKTFVGTFKYMSPERVQNQPYDFASDIWSLGLVLVECATGAYPYDDCHSYIDIVQSIMESPAPALPPNDFSAEFQEFVADCMRKEPHERATADVLIYSPWLEIHEATDATRCVHAVRKWLTSING